MKLLCHQIRPTIVSFLIFIVCEYKRVRCLYIGDYLDFQFNIITVSAIFAGFLYTNYSILIGISDTQIVKKISSTDLIEKRNNHILMGILNNFCSITLGLVLIIIYSYYGGLEYSACRFLQIAEIIYMLSSILFFGLSLREMNNIIKSVFNANKVFEDDDIKKIENILKSSGEK